MLIFPRKAMQAIEAVVFVACSVGPAPVSSKDIADSLSLPARHLEQIMQRLVKSGVLRGVRGPRGGYLLARERRRITVADICEALRYDVAEEDDSVFTPFADRVVVPLAREAEAKALEFLAATTLADLCARAAAMQPVKPASRVAGKMDFTI